jgi:hypothetical protein
MSQDQQQQRQPNNGIDPAYFAANALATVAAVFIRCDFGREAMGMHAFVAFLGLISFYLGTADKAVGFFVYLWFSFLILQRVRTSRMLRNRIVHSHYNGYPWLAMKMPFVRSLETATGTVEPLICFLGGAMLFPVSENLAGLIMACSLAFVIRDAIEREAVRKRVQRMQDAQIEGEYFADRYKRP